MYQAYFTDHDRQQKITLEFPDKPDLTDCFKDINRDRLTLHVYQSKGKKDRIVPLPASVLKMLEDYYKAYRPRFWLFEGQKPGEQYSGANLQKVLKSALKKSQNPQICYLTLAASYLCYSFIRKWHRFKIYPGITRTQQYPYNRNLYPCLQEAN